MGTIRNQCLQPADRWTPPQGNEIKTVLHLAGLTGGAAARVLGLGAGGDRTVRRWIGGQSPIPYAAWGLLCEHAGLGIIWKQGSTLPPD